MIELHSEVGRRRLDEFVRPGLLCAFDFDGTLAPIVPHPDQARLPVDIRRRLGELAGFAPVAIITGRSVDDIRDRLGFAPDFIVGNHGLEGLPGWEANAARHEALCSQWRAQLSRVLPEAGNAGIVLEDKRYSLSLHYRHAPDQEAAARRLTELFAQLTPAPSIVAGKQVFNLVPVDARHKGDALRQLMTITGAARALYAGDDVTDEDVFRLPRRAVLSIRVEYDAQSAAEFFLPQLPDVALLLSDLTRRLQVAGAVNRLRGETAGMV
ncbi:trehalose-phosphatase [Noviherbaspirillum autotrophicum]|uniref:trehalose-phosphatase n=1 Tax=Noviherbaspirillum autotrophicum TaxID=709839 RepID=UPI000A06EF1E|nr:trehalose-phosphatase [Noviherbaspirillum autotrophicum]